RNGRAQRPDLPHRLPRRLRPQRQQAPLQAGPGTVPALERQPRRPPYLGTTAPPRLNPETPCRSGITTNTVTPPFGTHVHRTSEYLRRSGAGSRGWKIPRGTVGLLGCRGAGSAAQVDVPPPAAGAGGGVGRPIRPTDQAPTGHIGHVLIVHFLWIGPIIAAQ